MSIEAMRLALDALVDFGWHIENCPQYPTWSESEKYPSCTCGYDTALATLRQALEQPSDSVEQEPVAYLYHDTVSAEFANPLADSTLLVLACDRKPNGRNETPLYAAPPKQEFVCSTGLCHYKHWVGLTDEEIVKASIGNVEGEHMLPHSFARAIEKLLREKNHD